MDNRMEEKEFTPDDLDDFRSILNSLRRVNSRTEFFHQSLSMIQTRIYSISDIKEAIRMVQDEKGWECVFRQKVY